MTINDDGWYFSKYVSGNAHLFTFKQEQSQYKKCNFNTCAVYAEIDKNVLFLKLKLNVYNFYIINANSFKLW